MSQMFGKNFLSKPRTFFQTFPKVKIFEPGFFFFLFLFLFFFKKKNINFNSYKSNLIEIGIVNVNDCLELLDGTLGVLCQILFFGDSIIFQLQLLEQVGVAQITGWKKFERKVKSHRLVLSQEIKNIIFMEEEEDHNTYLLNENIL